MTDASAPPPIGRQLRQFRVTAGMSQDALSAASGVSVRTISDLERGQRRSAHPETIRLLATALELTSDERRYLLEAARPDGDPATARTAAPLYSAVGSARPHISVPLPATPLVGRSSELETLTALLVAGTGGIVTLTGPGGVGKTRLAIEVAHRLAPTYADGAAFVDLATLTQPELAPNTIAGALGISPRSGANAEQLMASLGTRELLLVLDNLEQVIEAAPFIAQLNAACPRLSVLVTSRVRLRVSGERTFAVPPLSLADGSATTEQLQQSDAVQLFAERARRVDPRFELSEQNLPTVAEICRRLDGLPLAIELAAARLRVLSAPALLERLDRRLPLLTGGDRDRPPRHQSMRETIAWSYELLDPTTQRFLRWMSVFTGGLSLDSAEALGHTLGLDPDGLLEAVSNLVESGLAARVLSSHENPRFHLLETIREFGLEQLAGAGELVNARRFHAEHFLEFACRNAPRPDELVRDAWVRQLSTEHPNLVLAFDELCSPETADLSLRFAAALGPYWDYRRSYSESHWRLDRALAISAPEPTVSTLHVLFWKSLILGGSPDYGERLAAANRCIEMANLIGTSSDQAAALQVMAWVQEYHEQFDSARELLEQAMELWESVGNSAMHANCLMIHAGLEYARGELESATQEAARARVVFQDLGEIGWTAATMWYQGMIAIASGEHDRAATFYEESARAWLASESPFDSFKPLVGLADVGAAVGCYTEASRLLGAVDAMLAVIHTELMPFDKPGYERARAACLQALGPDRFDGLVCEGRLLSPDALLDQSKAIVECAVCQTTAGS